MTKKKTTTQTIPDYGDAQVNRLAHTVAALEGMDAAERLAAFSYLKSRYRSEWPSDMS